jgi:hypothetical protein
VVLEGGRHPVYYIRNVNSRLRTLPVAADAPITANTLTARSSGSATKNVPLTLDELALSRPATPTRSGSPSTGAR